MSRSTRLLFAVVMLLHVAAKWLEWGDMWTIPLSVGTLICAIIAMSEGQTRNDSHVTLNLRR